jgi:hypothetical protein
LCPAVWAQTVPRNAALPSATTIIPIEPNLFI